MSSSTPCCSGSEAAQAGEFPTIQMMAAVRITRSNRRICCRACNTRRGSVQNHTSTSERDKKQQLKYIVSCDGRWKNMGKLLLLSKIEASFEFYEAPPASDRIDSGLYFSALTVSPIQAPGWFSIMGFMMRLGLR
jgi:hypothetical protein